MNYFTVLTQIGAAKIAAATANRTLVELTHIVIGDGSGTTPLPEASQTQLVNEVFRTAVNELKIDEQNNSHVIARSILPANEGDFWIREVGVYDKDGDLIAVGNYPETYKPMLSDGVAKEVDLQVIFEVTNSDVVNLMIDPSIVMASQEYVNEKLIEKLNKKDHINFMTANCLLDGEITSTQNDLTSTLDILGDGSCVACYPLDGNANDLGNTYNGVTTSISYNSNGYYNQSAVFNGTDSFIDTIQTTYPKAISFRMKRRGVIDGYDGIIGYYNRNATDQTKSRIGLHIRDDGALGTHHNNKLILSIGNHHTDYIIDTQVASDTLNENEWYHVVLILDDNNQKCYVNGKMTYSNNEPFIPTSIDSVLLGCYDYITSARSSFSGELEQVRMFNKALEESEVSTLYKESFLSDVSLNNGEIVYANGKLRGYDLGFESIETKDISALTFQKGWNEVIKTKEGDYTVTQQLSYMAEESNGSNGNRFCVREGKYYDKNGIHLENQAPILRVLYDGMNIVEVKKVNDCIGLFSQNQKYKQKIMFNAKPLGTLASGFVVFKNILYNYGEGYNNETGEFIVPEDGIYSFKANVYYPSTSQQYTYVAIYVNDEAVINESAVSGSSGTNYPTISVEYEATFKKGDKVKIYSYLNVGEVYSSFRGEKKDWKCY